MKKFLGLLIVLTVMASPTLAQKITIDYAHDYDFETAKTFAYVETTDSDMSNDIMDRRIEQAIISELESGRLTKVDKDADLYVTYHVITEQNTVFNTTNYGYGGWGPGWGGYGGYGWGGYYGGGMGGSSTTTSTTYTEGTLVLDAYEPAKKELVWRGTGTVTVKAKPEKQMKQVDNILKKMGKKWQKILDNQGK